MQETSLCIHKNSVSTSVHHAFFNRGVLSLLVAVYVLDGLLGVEDLRNVCLLAPAVMRHLQGV